MIIKCRWIEVQGDMGPEVMPAINARIKELGITRIDFIAEGSDWCIVDVEAQEESLAIIAREFETV